MCWGWPRTILSQELSAGIAVIENKKPTPEAPRHGENQNRFYRGFTRNNADQNWGEKPTTENPARKILEFSVPPSLWWVFPLIRGVQKAIGIPRCARDFGKSSVTGLNHFFFGTSFSSSAERIFLIWLRAWIDHGPTVSRRV